MTADDLVNRLRALAPPALSAWIDAHAHLVQIAAEQALAAAASERRQQAKQRAAALGLNVVGGGAEPARASETRAPFSGLGQEGLGGIGRLTDPRSRTVLTTTDGGVPLTGIMLDYTEAGIFPEKMPLASVKDAEELLNWLNATFRQRSAGQAYDKTVLVLTWADGSVWRPRFDVDGSWRTHDLFGDEHGGGITWANTTDPGKVYAREGRFVAPDWRKIAHASAYEAEADVVGDPYPAGTLEAGQWLWRLAKYGVTSGPLIILGAGHGTGRLLVQAPGGAPYELHRHTVTLDPNQEAWRDHRISAVPLSFMAPTPQARVARVTAAEDAARAAAAEEARKKAQAAKDQIEIGPWLPEVRDQVKARLGSEPYFKPLLAAMRTIFRKHNLPFSVKQSAGSTYAYVTSPRVQASARDWEAADRLFPGLLGHKSGDSAMFDPWRRAAIRTDYQIESAGIRVSSAILPEFIELAVKAAGGDEQKRQGHAAQVQAIVRPQDRPEVDPATIPTGTIIVWWGIGDRRSGAIVFRVEAMKKGKRGVVYPDSTKGVLFSVDTIDRQRHAFTPGPNPRGVDGADFTRTTVLTGGVRKPAQGGALVRRFMRELGLGEPQGRILTGDYLNRLVDITDDGEEPVRSNPARRNPPGSHVQTLLFSRADGWTPTTAREWAERNGFKHSNRDMEVTSGQVRVRQLDSSQFSRFTTIRFGRETGIQAVLGWTD